jgi:hypothetical protein
MTFASRHSWTWTSRLPNTGCREAGHYSDPMECSRMIRTGRDRQVKAMRAMHLKPAGFCVSKVETSYHICRKCLFCWKTRLGDAHQQKAVYGSRPDEESKHACPHTHTRTQGPTHANSYPLSQECGSEATHKLAYLSTVLWRSRSITIGSDLMPHPHKTQTPNLSECLSPQCGPILPLELPFEG